MPSILKSHFSLPPSSLLASGSSSAEGKETFPKEPDNGVLSMMFVKTADIADILRDLDYREDL